MSSSSDSSASTPVIRHCAFCLKEIRGDEIKKCVKCLKRVYCSKECQGTDWAVKANQKGQGHKNWCGVDCCEEDIDWKVTPVPGKGLGIVALRDIPATQRILVETPLRDKNHPGVADLNPKNGTFEQKWAINKVTCMGDATKGQVLCLRIARANHSCNPNVGYLFDKSVQVMVLFTLREVKEGEEICVCYVGGGEMSQQQIARGLLFWGIVCGNDCVCKNEEYRAKFRYARSLVGKFRTGATMKMDDALNFIKKALEVGNELNTTLFRRQALYSGLQVAILKKTTLPLALEYLTEAYNMDKQIYHPVKGESVKKYKALLENPETHDNYLMHDKKYGNTSA